jgi:hypothetical protein
MLKITAACTAELKGKTIKRVRMRAFRDGRGGWAYDPIIEFTDGSNITFNVQESDVGRYGTAIDLAGMPP